MEKESRIQIQPLRVKHSVNVGDLVGAMGAIKKYYELSKRKVIVSQTIDLPAQYYQGATHPTLDENGTMVCCNRKMWEMVKPLIESQDYIHSFEHYQGQAANVDFDVIRGKVFVNLPNGAIQNWIPMAFPDLAFDLSKAWITLDGKCPPHIKQQVKGRVIVNFTERYRNNLMDYFFLKDFSAELVFAGTEKEWTLFCSKWNLNIPRLQVDDFLEYAYALKEARFFIGNQSFGWNICEAAKYPRIVELCNYAPNCIPGVGKDSYGYLHQEALRYYFAILHKKYK